MISCRVCSPLLTFCSWQCQLAILRLLTIRYKQLDETDRSQVAFDNASIERNYPSSGACAGIAKPSAALELAGTGVRVNIVGPGPVETRMFNQFAQSEENKANFPES